MELLARLRESLPRLSVGMITANLLELGRELEQVAAAGVESVHVDVMDGRFCPRLTVGPPVVSAIPGELVKDVHLMIEEPLATLDQYVAAGADIISFHLEATRRPDRVLQALAGAEVVRGVALSPGTPIEQIEPLLDDLELVLVLAVNPGFPGQTFMPQTAQRVSRVRELAAGREILVGVDGGVTAENLETVICTGADVIVAGSAVFDGRQPAKNARLFLDRLRSHSISDGGP